MYPECKSYTTTRPQIQNFSIHCKNVKVISTIAGLPQLHLFRGGVCKGHFNPSWVLSVADVSIMAQLANHN